MSDPVHSPPPPSDVSFAEPAPTNILGILSRIGPGLILTGSIVGSGELIATPATAASAGFTLLWLIVLGTVIKVFAQVEFGRFAICNGQAALWGMNDVPGPRMTIWQSGAGKLQANWLNWYWLVMFLTSLAQLGGIVGGVGQALAISLPLTDAGRVYNKAVETRARLILLLAEERYRAQQQSEGESASAALPSADRLRTLATDPHEDLTKLSPLEKQVCIHLLLWQAKGLPDGAFAELDGNGDKSLSLADAAPADDRLRAWFDRRAAAAQAATASAPPTPAGRIRPQHLDPKDPPELQGSFAAWDLDADGLLSWEELQAYRATLINHVLVFHGDGQGTVSAVQFARRALPLEKQKWDNVLWALVVTIVTAGLLVWGQYAFIEWTSTGLVAAFTFMTVACLVMLQLVPAWAIRADEIVEGLSFHLPSDPTALATAFFTFGIIGVGANELIQYPSWCLEKGYARFTGPRDDSPEWAERATGWLNVMQWDAWCSLVVYTFATIAFYLLGAAVLGRLHIVPQGDDMIRTLSSMYEPVFGRWTQTIFLMGAFAVLYSTFFVATAGHARVGADAVRIFTEEKHDAEGYLWWVKGFSAVFPFLSLGIYVLYPEPKFLVLISACVQAIMLPMLAITAIYFRYYRTDERVAPNIWWDICLWISFVALLASGLFAAGYKAMGY